MANSKKVDVVSLVTFGVMLLSVIMAIVGVCIAYTTTSGLLTTSSSTLADWGELNGAFEVEGYGAMAAFAYITLALSILAAIAFVVSKFVNLKFMKWVVLGVSALLIVSAIIALITAFTFCSKSDGLNPAAGPWLLVIFSVIGGAAGVFASLKN